MGEYADIEKLKRDMNNIQLNLGSLTGSSQRNVPTITSIPNYMSTSPSYSSTGGYSSNPINVIRPSTTTYPSSPIPLQLNSSNPIGAMPVVISSNNNVPLNSYSTSTRLVGQPISNLANGQRISTSSSIPRLTTSGSPIPLVTTGSSIPIVSVPGITPSSNRIISSSPQQPRIISGAAGNLSSNDLKDVVFATIEEYLDNRNHMSLEANRQRIAKLLLPADVNLLYTEQLDINRDFKLSLDKEKKVIEQDIDNFLKGFIEVMDKIRDTLFSKIDSYGVGFDNYYKNFVSRVNEFLNQSIQQIQKYANFTLVAKV